jgi:hypothetical protein
MNNLYIEGINKYFEHLEKKEPAKAKRQAIENQIIDKLINNHNEYTTGHQNTVCRGRYTR